MLDRSRLELQVARALESARHRAGLTQEEMVRRLGIYQSRPAKHQQRWHDWMRRPSSVSSLTLLAAAHLAGMSLDELLAEAGAKDAAVNRPGPNIEERLDALDERLDTLARVVHELQDDVQTLQAAVQQLAPRSRRTTPATTPPTNREGG